MSDRERLTITEEDLNELLAHVSDSGPEPSVDPSLLQRYLDGETAPKETEHVRRLLAKSGALREELLAMDTVARRGLEFQAMKPPVVPARRRSPSRSRRRPVFFALAAVLAVAAGLPLGSRLLQTSGDFAGLTKDGAFDGEQFEVDGIRSQDTPGLLGPARNAREAALLAFRTRVRWIDGDIRATFPEPRNPGPGRTRIHLASGEALSAEVPPGATGLRVAYLELPGLALFWSPAYEGPADIFLETPRTDRFLLAVVYEGDDGMSAALAHPVPADADTEAQP